MAIVFGGDSGLRENSFSNFVEGITEQFDRVMEGAKQIASLQRRSGATIPVRKENVYVDDGFQNVPGTVFAGSSSDIANIDDVKKRRITTQAPEVTVYIKKRLFSALRNEHDTKFMDSGEKLFMRASKLLFERKCSQIAAYEALTKLDRLISEESEFDANLIGMFADLLDDAAGNLATSLDTEVLAVQQRADLSIQEKNNFIGAILAFKSRHNLAQIGETVEALRRLQRDVRKTKNAINTTWVVDPDNTSDITSTGRGTGVIELTLIDSIRTDLSLEIGNKGSFNFTVENPYDMLSINNDDIEIALSSAFKEVKAVNNFVDDLTGPQEILDFARRKEEQLRTERNNRLNEIFINNANPITTAVDVAEIVFEINPTSGASNKVTGRIPTISEPFNKDNYALVLAQALDPVANLTLEESLLVKQIFNLLEQYIVAIGRISARDVIDENSDTEYARRQLRKFYLGKNIIQPMDSINVYVKSSTFRDSEVIGPLNAFLNANPFVRSFGNSNISTDLLVEEMRQFGLDKVGITTDLYRIIRTGTLLRNAGIHIFGGLVSSISSDYNANAGKYSLAVSGESNMKWLDLSRVNVTPSLDQAKGVLEDPLTPLEIKVDDATGLITGASNLSSENVRALSEDSLYFTNGDRKGDRADEATMRQDIKVLNGVAHSVWQHLPGLKYKWKQGIIVATYNANLRTALDGRRPEVQQLKRDVGVTVVSDPFANLDVADVVSLLVTGDPHNYETFAINSNSIGTFTPGQNNSPESFFDSFSDITRSTNRALGNFQPFKTIQIGRDQMAKRLSKQTELSQDNREISQIQSQLADLIDKSNAISPPAESANDNNKTDPTVLARTRTAKETSDRIIKLKKDLNDKLTANTAKIKDASSNGLRIYGDDVILDSKGTTTYSDSTAVQDTGKNAKIRSRILQLRPQLSTKFNNDQNLFIVSDDYDKDLDLQAFAINLASGEIPIWNSRYKTPLEICINATRVIDFEFFCDTQGHIQFRPPKYNKMPLSLLLKMILLSEESNIELMSPFVKALFSSRSENLASEVETLKLEIDIIGLLLNIKPDNILNRQQAANIFLDDLNKTTAASTTQQSNAAELIRKKRNELASKTGTANISNSSEDIDKIKEEIKLYQDQSTSNINTNRLGKLNQLLQLSSRRQIVEETLQKIQERAKTFQTKIVGSKDIKFGAGTGIGIKDAAAIVEPFGDLIEDDFYDFLGPGSSKRFIIYDDQLISSSFKESDQNVYCRVDVTGQIDVTGEQPGEIGGIPVIGAGATDFDLWKQYGWRSMDTVTKPFFKDGETQCAPYALMLLTRQHRDTVRANITIAGNEYYQLGDVVYINSKDLLYYVVGVSHSFTYNSGFTTSLDLRYGHPLGDFIPTPLDVIGKNLIKNQRRFNTTFINRRTAGTDIGRNAATIKFHSNEDLGADSLKSMLGGFLGFYNLTELKNALLRINSQKINTSFKQVEIRGYTRNVPSSKTTSGSIASGIIVDRMDAVKNWLMNPIDGFDTNGNPVKLRPEDFPALEASIFREFDLDFDPIDLSLKTQPKENIGRTPREETYNVVTSAADIEQVIEIVITFKE